MFNRICATLLAVISCALAPVSYAGQIRSIEPNATTGTALATVVEPAPLVHTTQLLPVDKKGRVGGTDVRQQMETLLDQISRLLNSAGSRLDQTVKLNVYVVRDELVPDVRRLLAARFKGEVKPAVAFVTTDLPVAGALVALDAVAVSRSRSRFGEVKLFKAAGLAGNRQQAHAAILPPDGAIYISGMADKGELPEATRKTLDKLFSALSHFELGREHVVQLKAFVHPMSDVSAVEDEIARYFAGRSIPPVACVQWLSTNIPIEIELIAAAPAMPATESVTFITPPGTTGGRVFSRVARIHSGERIYVSGLYGHSTDPQAQVNDIFETLDEVLKQTGSDFNHLVKATYYFSDPKCNASLDAVRPKIYDPKRPPAASKARVRDVGMAGRGITLDMIAVTVRNTDHEK